jgi:hypothetical protein
VKYFLILNILQMKKLTILILSIVLLSTTASFAQAWTLKIKWETSSANCDCGTTIGSKFVVSYTIIDIANGNEMVCADSFFVDPTETEKTIPVKCVKDHCDDISLTNIPNYTIYAYVGYWCGDTNPPEIVCDGHTTELNKNCLNFSSSQQVINVVLQ